LKEEGNYNSSDLYDDMLQPSSRATGPRVSSTSLSSLLCMKFAF